MPDTPRTLVQLQAILADNITADISPQDIRDFVVSTALVTGTGELGGTADVPTVAAVHSGSSHAQAVATAEAYADAADAAHVAAGDPHPGYLTDAEHTAIGSSSPHHVEDHDHDGSPTQKLLAANTHESPSADTHHAKSHTHDGADGSGSVAHASLSGVSANQHHNQAHTNTDHTTGVAPSDVTKATAAEGTNAAVARADHKHDISTAAPNTIVIGSAPAEGSATSLARSNHNRGVSSPAAPEDVTKAAAAAGGAVTPARADHKHDVSTAAPSAVSTANAEGTATSLARSDHVHAHEAAHIAHDTIFDAKGDLPVGTGADTAAKLAAGANKTVLGYDSAQTTGMKAIARSTATELADIGDSESAGSDETVPFGDHRHAHGSRTNANAHRDEDIDVTGMKQTFILAGWYPITTGGCGEPERIETTGTNKKNYIACPFDSAAAEKAFMRFPMPTNWDGSTVTFWVFWTNKTGYVATSSDGVAWTLSAVSYADGDSPDVAQGSPVTVTDLTTGNAQHRKTAESGALTIANTPAAGDDVYWELERTISDGADDLAADAYPLYVVVKYGITGGLTQ